MPDYKFVDLGCDMELAKALTDADRIGIDTEFMREKTYFSQLCLIQVAANERIICADPLNLHEADPDHRDSVWSGLAKPNWVLHSGRQDIEVFYQTSGLMPTSVFDTQIAAALLGYQPQLGYAGMVKDLFDVELDKSHTRADWSKRPLSAEVLEYAAEDVEYLLPACDLLAERLADLGRLAWAVEDSADLLDTDLYEMAPNLAIQRVKGARNLRDVARAAAHRLAAWREKRALRSNRPRQWILRDATLLELATVLPANIKALSEIDGLSEGLVRRCGDELLGIVKQAKLDKTSYRPPQRPDEKQKATLKAMQKIVAAAADRLGISAEIVAPKKELSAAMLGERESRVFSGWRRDVVGIALLEVLEERL